MIPCACIDEGVSTHRRTWSVGARVRSHRPGTGRARVDPHSGLAIAEIAAEQLKARKRGRGYG
jgi:hypothetical protein